MSFNYFMGDNPHYPSLVPPSIPSTLLVILWDVLLGKLIFSQVLKNLTSPSEIQSSLPRLEYLTPCQYLPGRKLISYASPATSQFLQPRPGKIAIATTSTKVTITVTFSGSCFLDISSSLPHRFCFLIPIASPR